MRVSKKKRTTLQTETSSQPLPEQQEFYQHLRSLTQSAVRTVIELVMREELDALKATGQNRWFRRVFLLAVVCRASKTNSTERFLLSESPYSVVEWLENGLGTSRERRPMMIPALRYEPEGERQRFEPQEQQRGEQQDRQIHLHVHLNLTLRARQRRSSSPNAIRVMRIFAAFVGATVMPLWLFNFAGTIQDSIPPTQSSLAQLAWVSLFVGLALAWCAVGALLLDLWRVIPRGRFGLFLLLILLLLIPYCFLHGIRFGPLVAFLGPLVFLLLFVVLIVHPLISALLLLYASREVRALRQEAPTHTWLSFVVVSGMALMLLSGLLLNLSLMLGTPPIFLQLFLPAMVAAVLIALSMLLTAMVTLWASFRQRQSSASQPRPKDVSPSDVDSPGERGGYRSCSLAGTLARPSCACGGVEMRSCHKTVDPSSGVQPFSPKGEESQCEGEW